MNVFTQGFNALSTGANAFVSFYGENKFTERVDYLATKVQAKDESGIAAWSFNKVVNGVVKVAKAVIAFTLLVATAAIFVNAARLGKHVVNSMDANILNTQKAFGLELITEIKNAALDAINAVNPL
ncbi:hypothetical protein N9N03_01330 [Chlamydiia bacterium]|nr:hypothetical protein [Chlamydiia bacterium]